MLKQSHAQPHAGGLTAAGIADVDVAPLPQFLAADYPSTLNFYAIPPRDELTLHEFETCALDRLRVLRAIEAARIRGNHKQTSQAAAGSAAASGIPSGAAALDDGTGKLFEPVLAKYLDLKRNTLIKSVGPHVLYEQRRKDHISHFILRLAFCRTEELRNWFVRQETALFRYRFSIEQAAERDAFVRQEQLDLTAVSVDDILSARLEALGMDPVPSDGSSAALREARARLLADLRTTYAPGSSGSSALAQQLADPASARSAVFYRVPFERVPELVSRRQVLLVGGWAYVPDQERSVLVVNAFREALMASLVATAKALPRLDEDDRLVPILNSLARQHIDSGYAAGGRNGMGSASLDGPVRSDDVDALSIHFPPCMQHLHQSLRQNAHLKHMGRLQFSLFLKGIGLPIEEALVFWRKAFHRMTDDEFSKKGYAYGVRYNYGMEGRRTNYAPYSCIKIITSLSPSTGDVHGCPFKHFSSDHLGAMLRRMRVSESGVSEVMRMSSGGHYELACTRLFELTRGQVHAMANAAMAKQGAKGSQPVASADDVRLVEPIGHPNQWFDLSVAGVRGNAKYANAGSGPTARANAAGSAIKQEDGSVPDPSGNMADTEMMDSIALTDANGDQMDVEEAAVVKTESH